MYKNGYYLKFCFIIYCFKIKSKLYFNYFIFRIWEVDFIFRCYSLNELYKCMKKLKSYFWLWLIFIEYLRNGYEFGYSFCGVFFC